VEELEARAPGKLPNSTEQKEREREFFPALFIVFAELVVLRVHGGPAADLVSDEPQLRRDAVPDLAGVARIARGKAALCPDDRGEGSIEVAVEQRSFGFNERPKVVEEMPRHTVDRQPPKHNARVEFGEKPIFERFRVRVGRNYFAEKVLGGALRLLVVCVRHRVNKPSLSV
jgi:hypothetical protein